MRWEPHPISYIYWSIYIRVAYTASSSWRWHQQQNCQTSWLWKVLKAATSAAVASVSLHIYMCCTLNINQISVVKVFPISFSVGWLYLQSKLKVFRVCQMIWSVSIIKDSCHSVCLRVFIWIFDRMYACLYVYVCIPKHRFRMREKEKFNFWKVFPQKHLRHFDVSAYTDCFVCLCVKLISLIDLFVKYLIFNLSFRK